MNDHVGKMILPADLPRILGLKFFSQSQLSENVAITEREFEATVTCLIQMGFVESWDAVRCPSCLYMWPEAPEGSGLTEEISCPLCNMEFSPEWAYRVYKMIAPLPK